MMQGPSMFQILRPISLLGMAPKDCLLPTTNKVCRCLGFEPEPPHVRSISWHTRYPLSWTVRDNVYRLTK